MTGRRLQLLAAVAVIATAAMATGALAQNAAPAVATPKRADGTPDLSGMWGGPSGIEDNSLTTIFPSRRCGPTQVECDERTNQSIDGEFTARGDPNRPIYKPEHWDKVQFLDMNTNKEDPLFICQPYGLPRVGPPARIVQGDKEVLFLYRPGGVNATTAAADYRVIPTDGRPHDPIRAIDVTFYGDSVGKWEGDTLVIDSVGFNDLTWFDKGGYFHSDKMHVVERLRREGNTLVYDTTVDDPEVLVEPWKMNTRRVPLNTSPAAYLPESDPCKDYDLANMVSQIRH